MLPSTTARVPAHTPSLYNEAIRRQTEENVARHARGPEAAEGRRGEGQVKAQVAGPALHEAVPAGSEYRVFGAAWAGESEVAAVEVSTDGGKTWAPARLLDRAVPYAWRFWEHT